MDDFIVLQHFFQTVGDANRLKIVKFIGDKERSVTEIVNDLKLSQPLVSHHLKMLRNGDVLVTNRKGPFVYYRLKDVRILEILNVTMDILKQDKTNEEN